MIRTFNDDKYLRIEAERLGGTPCWLSSDDRQISGVVKRTVPDTQLYDVVSAYGYPDLFSQGANAIDLDFFIDSIAPDMSKLSIISAYFRIGMQEVVCGETQNERYQKSHVGNVIHVPLEHGWEAAKAGFRKQLRNDLRKPSGISITPSDNVMEFYEIYTQNMLRVGAKKDYFFSPAYLQVLCALPGTELFLAHDKAGPVAGAITVAQGDLLYYHLGATADRALNRSPMKFVLADIIERNAERQTFRSLVLGGGLGGGEDALLRFKRGFSKAVMPVTALKVIFDLDKYHSLLVTDASVPFEGFFPAYRAQNSPENK